IVDWLVIKELVEKKICPKEKRLVDVTIKEKGQNLLRRLDEVTSDMDAVMQNVTEEEAMQLSLLLDKLRS
ncbi:MAG TPA: hypothetical protein VM871_02850, partial [Flavisolibacter sp.]|nr:hypothetical protein [Flavisolibacter sp.]